MVYVYMVAYRSAALEGRLPDSRAAAHCCLEAKG